MDYIEALEYLEEIDTTPYCDQQFDAALGAARNALRECIRYRDAVAALPDHQERRNHAAIQSHP